MNKSISNPIAADTIANIEAQRDRATFSSLPLETRLRNTCPRCGCRLVRDDFSRALAFVTGPPRTGRCTKCWWVGTK